MYDTPKQLAGLSMDYCSVEWLKLSPPTWTSVTGPG